MEEINKTQEMVEQEQEEQEEKEEKEEESNNDNNDNNEIKISKNQLKKLKKSQKWEGIKKLKKEQKRNKRKLSEINNENNNENNNKEIKQNKSKEIDNEEIEISQERKQFKQQRENEFIEKCKSTYSIVIDCSWENEHTDSTLKSLTQQVMFCYGINRRSNHPSRLFITGVGERTLKSLSKNNCQSWKSATIHQNDFLEVLTNYYQELKHTNPELNIPDNPLNNIVYLTSDATEVLEELDDSHIYIIGGIVDRNRLKGATYNKAKELNLRTAKLPIKEYYKMKATHVLTVNHVFDILKQYSHYKSWLQAIEHVLPERKGAELNDNNNNDNNSNNSNNNASNNGGDDEENNENNDHEEIDSDQNKIDEIHQNEIINDSHTQIEENNF